MNLKQVYTFILHLLFWTLSIIIYLIYSNKESFLPFLFDHIIIALLCYLNYFILIPSLLKKNKLKYYIIWISSYFITFSLIYELWLYYLSINYNAANEQFSITKNFLISFLVSIYYGGASTFARLAVDWNNNIETNRDLSIQKTNAQIQLMKSNINLPFMLQTLTYAESQSVIHPKNAIQPILQLSNIIRYGLYESQSELIELKRELEVLNEYAELYNQFNSNTSLHIALETSDDKKLIIPNLLVKSTVNWIFYFQDKLNGALTIKITFNEDYLEIKFPTKGQSEEVVLKAIFPEIDANKLLIKRENTLHYILLKFQLIGV